MNKIKFNKLTIVEQVNYFNELLSNGSKITEICSDLNISYNTIRDRFNKANYTYNKYSKKYECIEKIFNYDEEFIELAIEKVVNKVFNNTSNKNESRVSLTSKSKLDGKIINRSFRIYEPVLNEFVDFCNKTNKNQYEILSSFIQQGMENYNNIG